MGKISLDLSTIKAAGVYTLEIDNSIRTTTTTNAIRLCAGFSNKGPFNRPVYLQQDSDRLSIYGDIDTKLEHKGCFFNRMLRTLISNGPVLALNLLKVDDRYEGPDQVNYTTLSLNAGAPNPAVQSKVDKYGEYDYVADAADQIIYGTTKGDVIPYVGTAPFASLYNRSRFWTPDKDLLTAAAARGLQTSDYTSGAGSYEHTNLLNFANVGTEEISILVFKPENIIGYNVTASSWYGGEQNIPFGWIRPGDYLSDYFIQVVCVKGNWSNYPILAQDPIWTAYFDSTGIIKNKVNSFISAEGVTLLGSWQGIIIPNFVNKQGDNISIERKINASTETTGLLMSFNEDAAHILNYDYTGIDMEEEDPGPGGWGYDLDGDHEISGDNMEGAVNDQAFIVDMVGHEIFKNMDTNTEVNLYYKYVDTATSPINIKVYKSDDSLELENAEAIDKKASVIIPKNAYNNLNEHIGLLKADEISYNIEMPTRWVLIATDDIDVPNGSDEFTETLNFENSKLGLDILGYYVFNDAEIEEFKYKNAIYAKINLNLFNDTDKDIISHYAAKAFDVIRDEEDLSKLDITIDINNDYILKPINLQEIPIKTDAGEQPVFATGIYMPLNFIDSFDLAVDKTHKKLRATDNNIKNLITTTEGYIVYYTLSSNGKLVKRASSVKPTIAYHNVNDERPHQLTYPTSTDARETNNVRLSFNINNNLYFIDLLVDVDSSKRIQAVRPGAAEGSYRANAYMDFNQIYNEDYSEVYGAQNIITSEDMSANGNNDLSHVLMPDPTADNDDTYNTASVHFLSYNYIYNETAETDTSKLPLLSINNAYYFNDATLWEECPITSDTKNMFIITDSEEWQDTAIKVGDLVQNITYNNEIGETARYRIIPGLTRIIKKQFVQVNTSNGSITWKGKQYAYNGSYDKAKNGAVGFYVFTTTDPVLITYINLGTPGTIVRQLPLSDEVFSHTLRFIPMRGLKLTSRHRPGYDAEGNISIEDGIKKIYSVLEEPGIQRGLCNPAMVDYRYIIDSMSYGLDSELGGKVYLSRLASFRGKCTALLNMPSAKQFAVSSNPYFCDSYTVGTCIRPSFDTKYIPEGGNTEMGSSRVFSLPNEDDGAKFTAAFFPHLIYNENGRTIVVPPAADVANVLYRKFTGVNDTYAICANQSGILSNRYLSGLEFDADTQDREFLEPFGVNTIIRDKNQIMIYGNQTCYQTLKSDFNKLHVRENLNTMEIECHEILKQYNFLYNTAATRAAIVQMLTPVLQTMQTSGALSAYEIICDETNNTADIIESDYGVVDIAVWFNHGMEKIIQRITVNRYGSQSDQG